jgi:hypothetical protein
MRSGANHFGEHSRVTGRQYKGCVLNTSCDQQAGLCVDAGMGAELVLRMYRLTAHRRRGVAVAEEGSGSGCKEPSVLAHRRMNGVPASGLVCWG